MSFYTLQTQNYLSRKDEMYLKVITVDRKPEGPLVDYVSQLKNIPLSKWDRDNRENQHQYCQNQCIWVLKSISNKSEFMCIQEIPTLLTFLHQNGYTIDTSISKLFMKNKDFNQGDEFICFVKYSP